MVEEPPHPQESLAQNPLPLVADPGADGADIKLGFSKGCLEDGHPIRVHLNVENNEDPDWIMT